jgi:hypothetical protein
LKNAPALVEPGQGVEAENADCFPSDIPLDFKHQARVDPRLAFLQRAAVKLDLVEAGYQALDTAFADLVVSFRKITLTNKEKSRRELASGGQVEVVMPKHHSTRTRGPQALSAVLARAILCIVVDAQRDWLDGNPVRLSDIRTLVEQMLRDEFTLIEESVRGEFRNAWHDEHQAEFEFEGGR